VITVLLEHGMHQVTTSELEVACLMFEHGADLDAEGGREGPHLCPALAYSVGTIRSRNCYPSRNVIPGEHKGIARMRFF